MKHFSPGGIFKGNSRRYLLNMQKKAAAKIGSDRNLFGSSKFKQPFRLRGQVKHFFVQESFYFQMSKLASDGMRQSLFAPRLTVLVRGPSGEALRLNCWVKNLRRKICNVRSISSGEKMSAKTCLASFERSSFASP